MFKNRMMKLMIKNCFHPRIFVMNRKQIGCKILILAFAALILVLFYRTIDEMYANMNEAELEGWGKNVSRNATLYVNPARDTSFSHADPNICSTKKPLVVIIVCSDIKKSDSRKAIRETWAKDANLYNILVLFLVGISRNEEINMRTSQESLAYKDIISEEVIEHYYNVTIKSIFMLKWVHEKCTKARFLMKADDDTYLNLANLYEYTRQVPENKMESFLVGRSWEELTPHRESNSRWYTPRYIYPEDQFPPFVLGIGYIMSTQLAEKLYFQSLRNNIVHIEDVYLTGICARQLNVTAKDEPLFHFPWSQWWPTSIDCDSSVPKLIAADHAVSATRMYELFDQLNKCNV